MLNPEDQSDKFNEFEFSLINKFSQRIQKGSFKNMKIHARCYFQHVYFVKCHIVHIDI